MMKKKIDSPFRKLKVLLVLPLVAMVFYAFAKPEYVSTTPAFPTDKVNDSADGNDVKGKVVKTDGKPLHGTSVIVTGTTIGAIADVDGNFKLNSVPKDAKIAFSFVGFKTVLQTPDINQPMTITMVIDTVKFENGVVAVGYGKPAPPPPPSAFDLKNPPICIVDGVQVDSEKGKAIKFEDIETHTSLEGKAATDKYGEKGKYGVLEITLKKVPAVSSEKKNENVNINTKAEVTVNSKSQQTKEGIFVVIEEMPEFPGGDQACKDFIARNLKYPLVALNKGKTGKVFVTFIVNKNGKVENAKVIRGIDPALDAEVVRVVNSLPDWKPGKQRGQAVDVVYTMPIEFMLQ